MANKMLVDATHPEETRVVVLRGNRVEEFDFESAQRRQLRGNIYLAKVTRVEPSLQAAFVDYGGNRHGFLAFSEIHPDYYQIPFADRQALIDEEQRAHRAADDEDDRRARRNRPARQSEHTRKSKAAAEDAAADEDEQAEGDSSPDEPSEQDAGENQTAGIEAAGSGELEGSIGETPRELEIPADIPFEPAVSQTGGEREGAESAGTASADSSANGHGASENGQISGIEEVESGAEEEMVESVGGADALEEVSERPARARRQYKIQEVIKRRQIMLVQVVKEERGTKGAALTTYLSLAGRYSVLMPNTARGGGISRKITNAQDRKRLKEVAQELEVPEGMGVILRTAGANRTKTEVKRDFEYLLRLWETVRDLTLQSTAPKLVYEEGSLIKRSIRDLYGKDIDEVVVEGDDALREAKDFMRMLMPSHAKNVKAYKDPQPIFTRYGIESQLDAMFSPIVQLRSGGYIVLNQTEALVSIDVNSGRSTREHHIEDTALKTNLEAAEEIARQLRLRDLAGLIVIDFIDMDEKRNNRSVERKLKECLRNDRARIQVGRISHFGLLEMSRQRIRTSVLESSTDKCPHCGGTGHVRSVASVALQLVRALEEMLLKGATHNLIARTRSDVALYVLNHKRAHLRELEERFRLTVAINADPAIGATVPFVIERGEQVHSVEAARALVLEPPAAAPAEEEEDERDNADQEDEAETEQEGVAEGERESADERETADGGRRRKRRRRRRGERDREDAREPQRFTSDTVAEHTITHGEDFEPASTGASEDGDEAEDAETAAPTNGESKRESERRRRRRGRRGGRRRERNGSEDAPDVVAPEEPEIVSAVSDFDVAPPPSVQAERAPPVSSQQEKSPEAESPRRRSTVREPAPFFALGEEPAAAPHPSPPPPAEMRNAPTPKAETEEPAEAQPRRSGWWSRRMFGKG